MNHPSSPPSPARLFDAINSFQRSRAIQAAVELSLFTAIGKGAKTAAAIAKECGASERGIRILCDYLVINGFLAKEGSSYSLTDDAAAFLDRNSPAYMGGTIEFLLHPTLTSGFMGLAESVRKGGHAASEQGMIAPDHPIWVNFARAMAALMAMPAQLMAEKVDPKPDRPLKILDIASGHGLFGAAFARRNPRAEVTAVDWPGVLEVAKENAEKAGVRDRYRTLPGSAFEVDFGGGYDLVLLTNFLHHFDPPTCEKLLKKVRNSLAEGGRVATLEFVPNEDRVSPAIPAAFSLVMLASTPGGDAYTFPELERMFRSAGFSKSEAHPLPPTFQTVVVSHR